MCNILILIIIFCLLFSGCGGKEVVEVEPMPSQKVTTKMPEAQEPTQTGSDSKTVQEFAGRNVVNPEEAIKVSNRMLQEDTVQSLDEQTLNNLERMLLAALPQSTRETQPIIQRNLGIVNFHNRKYSKARQALQYSNETNPRDARTHYYLACLFNHQARIYAAKGEKTKAQRFQKRAEIEIETARKLEPSNRLYRKGLPSL